MKIKFSSILYTVVVIVYLASTIYSQEYKILESDENHLLLEFDYSDKFKITEIIIDGIKLNKIIDNNSPAQSPGYPCLPTRLYEIGIPFGRTASIIILESNNEILTDKFIISTQDSLNQPLNDLNYDEKIYGLNALYPLEQAIIASENIFRFISTATLSIAPFQFNPIERTLVYNKRLLIKIVFNKNLHFSNLIIPVNDPMTNEFIKLNLLNSNVALGFTGKVQKEIDNSLEDYWYDPAKNYAKIFVNSKGVYRVTYQQLLNSGFQIPDGTLLNNIGLFNLGQIVPIDVVDNGDSIFNAGDYFQFVGYPQPSSSYTYLNIYNNSNIYWFTYENDSLSGRYKSTNGFPTSYQTTFQSVPETVHFENDSLFERLGYAPNGNRDFWFWGKATAQNHQSTGGFEAFFPIFDNFNPDIPNINLKVSVQGMMNLSNCFNDNQAYFELTGQPLGSIKWDGQNTSLFSKKIYVADDSIRIYPEGNVLRVWNYGDACPDTISQSGDIRINWFEFEYNKYLRADTNYLSFKAPANSTGILRYWTTLWQKDNMKVYVPQKNKLIDSVQILEDQYQSVLFVDTILTSNQPVEYFCISDDYEQPVDSIVVDIPSNLRGIQNGADYIIITHPKFNSVALRLKTYREQNFTDTTISNPRIQIVDVEQIYDEFSFGFLEPYAIKDFIKFAFENWQLPAPSYITLLGDMSYDYRKILSSSRDNFIPAIPFFSFGYGIAASDNNFVSVVGSDVVPDIALGRISIETVLEGNNYLDKLINYPQDDSKNWKENNLLIASGLSLDDEIRLGFNDASIQLDNSYIKSNGYKGSKIFRYPSKPEHWPFQGEGPKIRSGINEGATLVNYYGHGGGYQWDLVFLNDDIYLLENEGRLPFVTSVTCYTAHFDNQDVFGEQFIKIPNKGAIGFFGSSGLTYWEVGKDINRQFYNQIFNKRNFIVGKAILNAKNSVPPSGIYGSMISLLTLLGEPLLKLALPEKPDFSVTQSDITISPNDPLINDTVHVKVKLLNLGPIFNPDSVMVGLYASSSDTSYKISSSKIGSFGQIDSVVFTWVPDKSGLYELTFKINENQLVSEDDLSDNFASNFFSIYSIDEPSIINPTDGFNSDTSSIEFIFADPGYYLNRNLIYYIEVDTSVNFLAPIYVSNAIIANNGLLSLQISILSNGEYFWRSRIYDGENYGNWSDIRSFSITTDKKNGYFAHGNILKSLNSYNLTYSDSSKSLLLNTDLLPPKPGNNTFLESIIIDPPLPDSIKLNTITTDGTYFYCGTIKYFVSASYDSLGRSGIYKIGTGYNGSIKGMFYGKFSNFLDKIENSIFYHSDGNIYVYTGNPNYITRINIQTEEIDSVFIPDGILRWDTAKPEVGAAFLNSDGQFVYNLTARDSLNNYKYILRKFDPSLNWIKVNNDLVVSGSSYEGFTGFFVADGYLYPAEYLYSNYMRRIRLSDGFYEEEWYTHQPFESYYSWSYDWVNNVVYSGVFRPFGYVPKIGKWLGSYVDAQGSTLSNKIGPSSKWKSVNYQIDDQSQASFFQVDLQGISINSNEWITIIPNLSSGALLDSISALEYPYLRLFFSFTDSSFGASNPIKLRNFQLDYDPLPELVLTKNNLTVYPDSIMQGFNTEINLKIKNYGVGTAQGELLDFFLNNDDTSFYSPTIVIKGDSTITTNYTLNTEHLLFNNYIKVLAKLDTPELFTFNNKTSQSFYIIRDAVKPNFTITFDDKELIDGDIISSEPTVVMTVEDNSPLPITQNHFSIQLDNIPLSFYDVNDSLKFDYTPYPNSKAVVTWTPKLEDGSHTLTVFVKDSSGNPFNSSQMVYRFNVFNNPDLLQVYNYPNPFKDKTDFTFEVRGVIPPEELKIKIFTVAGRLIKEIILPGSSLQIGFNRIPWDGLDQDGDEIANGVYFYKIISKHGNEVKTVTQKLAKLK
jgi:hypothetical protein